MTTRLCMVIETFHGGDPVPVYRRFQERERMMPDGLRSLHSWVSADLSCCYQLTESEALDAKQS